ncbi:MAG: nucleoside triphosphate pyrophosphohydrolase [candidate division Zixibacteria bacterium]
MENLKAKVLDSDLAPFERLTLLMKILRSPKGCSWDRKQDHKSLLPYLIEEAYEVVEAVESEDHKHLSAELGDLLVQVVFHAQIAAENGHFTINDSINSIVAKLIERHPHVFEDRKELNPAEVRDQWEQIKLKKSEDSSVLGGLPRSMPALTAAFRVGQKAGGIGFDWKSVHDVFEKIEEEIGEVKEELAAENPSTERVAEEIGDLLFATASLARKASVDPEMALRSALEKFRDRFSKLEKTVRLSSRSFDEYELAELESIWQRIKN